MITAIICKSLLLTCFLFVTNQSFGSKRRKKVNQFAIITIDSSVLALVPQRNDDIKSY